LSDALLPAGQGLILSALGGDICQALVLSASEERLRRARDNPRELSRRHIGGIPTDLYTLNLEHLTVADSHTVEIQASHGAFLSDGDEFKYTLNERIAQGLFQHDFPNTLFAVTGLAPGQLGAVTTSASSAATKQPA
jgi:hypothetical protein